MDSLPPVAERHAANQAAFQRRDLEAYLAPFAPDLVYYQVDGKAIDRARLARQVASQFARLSAADWTFRVESVERVDGTFVETGVQEGWVATTALGILHRLWRLERRGRYTWRQDRDGWKISEVTVISERVSGAGVQVGLRPKLPPTPSEGAV